MPQKQYCWLSVEHSTHVKGLKIQNESVKALNHLYEHIWFNLDEMDEAMEFLRDVKDYLRYLYCYKYKHEDRADWMTKDWVENNKKP